MLNNLFFSDARKGYGNGQVGDYVLVQPALFRLLTGLGRPPRVLIRNH